MKSDKTINDKGFGKKSAKALGEGGRKRKISRMWVIRQLCQKKHGTVRPTAIQINTVIRDWNLNKYTIDGKKRSKEALKEAMSKAYASLI